jgi:hypothetical protein
MSEKKHSLNSSLKSPLIVLGNVTKVLRAKGSAVCGNSCPVRIAPSFSIIERSKKEFGCPATIPRAYGYVLHLADAIYCPKHLSCAPDKKGLINMCINMNSTRILQVDKVPLKKLMPKDSRHWPQWLLSGVMFDDIVGRSAIIDDACKAVPSILFKSPRNISEILKSSAKLLRTRR